MRKCLSLLLAFALLCFCLPASAAEKEAAQAWSFSFSLHLNEEAVSSGLRDRARGYAALFDALRFEGTYARSLSSSAFELQLSVIPVDPEASPVSFRIHGLPHSMMVGSPLMGEEQFVLDNDALLEFCMKGYEHLGLPLPYVALMLPYTWENAFRFVLADWEGMMQARTPEGIIPAAAVSTLADKWTRRLESDPHIMVFSTSLGLDTGFDAAFHQFLADAPAYLTKEVTGGEDIRIVSSEGGETWSSGCGEFVSRSDSPEHRRLSVFLPPMESGYQPSFLFQQTLTQSRLSGQIALSVSQTLPEKEDLLDLRVSAAALPESWPADCDSLVNFNLTGGLFANLGFTGFLKGAADGSLALEIRKPSLEPEPGDLLLSLTGSLLPVEGDVTLDAYDEAEANAATSILHVNETSLKPFVEKILPTFAGGFLKFLFGIPTAACQVVLDDLTDYGVLGMLLGD